MEKQKDQHSEDIEYLFAHDQYLRLIKGLEQRREGLMSSFSAATLDAIQLAQISGEIRATNELMGVLGFHQIKTSIRYHQA